MRRRYITITLLLAVLLVSCGQTAKQTEGQLKAVEDTFDFQKSALACLNIEKLNAKAKAEEEEKKRQEEAARQAEEAKKYHFLDVCQDDYEMILDDEAIPNPYNNDCFEYITTDAKGVELVHGKPMEITPKGISLGYKGIIKYEDDNYTSRFGVDVSKYLGHINWEKAKEDGVEFAIARIGFRGYGESGTIHLDETAMENIRGAKDAGIDVGVYFFSQAINEEEAIEEAEFILNQLDGITLEMPIVFDPEHILHDVARTDDVSREQFTKNCIAFCERVKEAGYEPMIYANMKWEAYDLEMGKLTDYPFWYADYEKIPQSPYKYSIWQYSQAGKLDGFNGAIDFNVQIIEK